MPRKWLGVWDLEENAKRELIRARQVRRYRWAWRLSWELPLIGVLLLALWAYGATTTWSDRLGTGAAIALVGAAAMAIGGLLGFLFGVPKVLTEAGPAGTRVAAGDEQEQGTVPAAAAASAAAQGQEPAPAPAPAPARATVTNAVRGGVSANTNLEQISDWLTKILVGVGLVQIGQAPEAFARLVRTVGRTFALPDAAHVVGSVLIFFAVVGFLDAYLLTRLALTGAFEAAATGRWPTDDERK